MMPNKENVYAITTNANDKKFLLSNLFLILVFTKSLSKDLSKLSLIYLIQTKIISISENMFI